MISSLSMVKCKPNWGGSAATTSSAYRNAATSGASAALVTSGTVRTRSALAAAEDSSRRRPFPSAVSSRGRRRRRGAGMVASSSNPSLLAEGVDSNHDDQDESGGVSSVGNTNASASDGPTDFACPQHGCKKRFADIIGVRFHLDLCHGQRQKQEPTTLPPFKEAEPKQAVVESCPKSKLEPPQLAKVNSNGVGENSSVEPMDEDPPPPKLDRGPMADEVVGPPSSMSAMCEPPTASPAYSDISDDGPAAPQKTRTSVSAVDDVGRRPWPPQPAATPSQPPPQPSVLAQSQVQPSSIDWSARRRVIPPVKSPFEFNLTPQQVPANGMSLAQLGMTPSPGGGGPYAHQQYHQLHHGRQHLSIPPTAHTSTEKLFHLANLVATGGNPSNISNSAQSSSSSSSSSHVLPPGMHPYRP